MKPSRAIALVLVVIACGADRLSSQSSQRPLTQNDNQKDANPQAVLLKDYKERIDAYLKIHNEAKKSAPPLKETHEPADIKNAQDALAARIRERRVHAKQGDILTPEIAKHFRALLSPELKGEEGRDTRKVLKDDAPAAVPLKVNAKYPSSATLPTVPANLLLNLPTLPKELDYRIVNKDLILRDVDADIIVDFMQNAIR
jgi:hypothetical protein